MVIIKTTMAGVEIRFTKHKTYNCQSCEYSCKKLFGKRKCELILGLDIDKGDYGFCDYYI